MSEPFDKLHSNIRPEHDIRNMPGFETPEQVTQRRAKLHRLMPRFSTAITPRLLSCDRDLRPCGSGACPPCMRDFRINWCAGIFGLLERIYGIPVEDNKVPDRMVTVSLVHVNWERPPGDLDSFNMHLAKDQVAHHLVRAGLGHLPAIGGFDFSFNVDAEGRWQPHWQPQLYLIMMKLKDEDVSNALKKRYVKTVSTPRPIRVETVTSLIRPISYTVKSVFCVRSSYLASDGNYNARDFSLKPPQQHELSTYLDHNLPTDRIFLRKFRLSSELALRPTGTL